MCPGWGLGWGGVGGCSEGRERERVGGDRGATGGWGGGGCTD